MTAYTHKVTSYAGPLGESCPPAIISVIWPSFDGWPCELDNNTLLVTVPDSAPAPADLGPLVKVELVSE